jgi:hypothetical protein
MADMDYIYIRAWGVHQKSMPYYIRDEIERAREDNVPHNVIYKREDGTWATIDEVGEPTRTQVARLAGQIRPGHLPQRNIYEDKR